MGTSQARWLVTADTFSVPREAGLCFFDIRVLSVNLMFFYLISGARVLKLFEKKKKLSGEWGCGHLRILWTQTSV